MSNLIGVSFARFATSLSGSILVSSGSTRFTRLDTRLREGSHCAGLVGVVTLGRTDAPFSVCSLTLRTGLTSGLTGIWLEGSDSTVRTGRVTGLTLSSGGAFLWLFWGEEGEYKLR